MGSGAAQRARVIQLAKTDVVRALEAARQLADPWFRCQALAAVAQAAAADARPRALQAAFAAADELADINRRVTAASWPLKVLCSTASGKLVSSQVKRLLGLAGAEPSPVRRADALNYLLGAVIAAPRSIFCEVLEHMIAACVAPLADGRVNGKGQSHLVTWAVITHAMDPAVSVRVLSHVVGPTLRARAEREIQATPERTAAELCSWPNLRE